MGNFGGTQKHDENKCIQITECAKFGGTRLKTVRCLPFGSARALRFGSQRA